MKPESDTNSGESSGEEEDLPLLLDDVESEAAPNAETPESGTTSDAGSLDRQAPDIVLPTGQALTLGEASLVTAGSLTRVVAVLGEQGAGKTTLLASIWESFLRGPYQGYLFAGSRTQPGFDRRCFDARIASARLQPDTERTEVRKDNERYVLHIAVRSQSVRTAPEGYRPPVQHLLLPDLSGEDLREARQSSEVARSFPLIRRADHIVFLADGARLANRALRHEAAANVLTLFRRLIEEDIVGDSLVHVAVTKDDLVSGQGATPGASEYADRFLRRVVETFGDHVKSLKTYKIAARPEGSPEIAVGVGELFRQWVEASPYLESMAFPPDSIRAGDRESVRWALRFSPSA